MNKAEFKVEGSSGDLYRVLVERHDFKLNAFCTCMAGEKGQSCKHKMRILCGNSEGIVDGDLSLLGAIPDWITGTSVDEALSALSHAEDQLEAAKRKLADAKKILSFALRS